MKIKNTLVSFLVLWHSIAALSPSSTLMINPGIDADEILSQQTYECALTLKHELQKRFPSLHTALSRALHERADQKHITSCCNHLSPDLFISIHLRKSSQQNLFVYSYIQNSLSEYAPLDTHALFLLPVDKAHLTYTKESRLYAQKIVIDLKKTYPAMYHYAFPFAPLRGIHAPALAFELTVAKPKEWRLHLSSLITSLSNLIHATDQTS